MADGIDSRIWWGLHLCKARGETLSEEDRGLYDAELARQDRGASPQTSDLEALKKMRAQAADLATLNNELRSRLQALEREIGAVEKTLSHDTRAALGVEG